MLRLTTFALPPLMLLVASGIAKPADIEPVFPQAPRLATTAAEWAKVKSAADFESRKAAAIKAGDALLKNPPPLPEGFGSWYFYYACPDDGTYLQKVSLTQHKCPKCQKHYKDDQTVAAYRCLMHHAVEHASVKLGWAYAYSGEAKYAQAVKRILLKLATDYETYPIRLDRWGHRGVLAPLGGRRYVQSLDEAVGVIRLAKGYDLTRNSSAWTAADKKLVEEKFFRQTAKTLLVFNQDINNHQTWYNAGLMACASVLADADLVRQTLTMKGGFYDQLQRSLGEDGLWYEGTMAYQNYALQAMVEIVDIGRRSGLPLHKHPRMQALVRSSLDYTYPNGSYPCINDSDPSSFRNFNWSYDWAWKVYGDPVFAQAASVGNPKKLTALLGPQAKAVSPLPTETRNFGDVGVVALRIGQGMQANAVFFDYGRHGQGHGHFDKLSITLYAAGREWLLDTGRIGYTHKEYKTWVKHTVAHNTVVLGGKSQSATKGKLLWLKTGKDFVAAAAQSEGAYRGSTLRRYLVLTPKMLVDVFDVESDQTQQIDWLAHAATEPVRPLGDAGKSKPATLGSADGYAHLREIQRWPASQASQWDFPGGTAETSPRLRLTLPAAQGESIYTAIGIGVRLSQKAPCIVRRRNARQARFVTVYDLTGQGDYVRSVRENSSPLPTLTVQTAEGNRRVEILDGGVKIGD